MYHNLWLNSSILFINKFIFSWFHVVVSKSSNGMCNYLFENSYVKAPLSSSRLLTAKTKTVHLTPPLRINWGLETHLSSRWDDNQLSFSSSSYNHFLLFILKLEHNIIYYINESITWNYQSIINSSCQINNSLMSKGNHFKLDKHFLKNICNLIWQDWIVIVVQDLFPFLLHIPFLVNGVKF